MRIKVVSAAIVAAIYGVGSGFAGVLPSLPNGLGQATVGTPTKVAVDNASLQAFSAQVQQPTMMQNDGINVQVRGQTAKFIDESDIHGEQVYLVRLQHAPVAAFKQQWQAQAAKSAVESVQQSAQLTDAPVADYQQQLLSAQRQVVNDIQRFAPQATVRRQFSQSFNGFSIKLTPQQAKQVAQLPQVAFVQRSKNYELLSDVGPQRIAADKVWNGQTELQLPFKGEGVVMGIIDTGINSDHPSFAEIGADGYQHHNPRDGYLGDCAGDAPTMQCNEKLIGVRSYDVITGLYKTLNAAIPANGEDYQGHGSHVASTAAGNVLTDVDYVIANHDDNGSGEVIKADLFSKISGVAPHANIIAYQVCYPDNDAGYGGCPAEALVSAIEDAITDQVDVINFSIGGADSSIWNDSVQQAFLGARAAGISIAAAAGNGGQSCGTECFGALDNASPWLMNVAASTHEREVAIETALTNPTFINPALGSEVPQWNGDLVGGAINNGELTGVIVQAKDYKNVNGVKDDYCGAPYAAGTFDNYPNGQPIVDLLGNPANVIVVCRRNSLQDANGIARTAKADNVKAGGADGFIMHNYAAGDAIVGTASYSLPAAHISYETWNGDASNGFYGLEDWVDSTTEHGHMITIGKTVIERRLDDSKADWLALFSSRGPSFSNPEVLVPMVAAPGVGIYAAFADQHPFSSSPANSDFAQLSGTSMASPHVAGSLALIRQAHPQWTAAEVQSALAMTAEDVVQYHYKNTATGDAEKSGIYRSGTGRINVAKAIDTGLVMDETIDNFHAANPDNGGTVHKLNLPALVDFSCQPECQWVRTVTATKDGSWKLSHGPVTNWAYDAHSQAEQNGVHIEFSPAEFSLKAGEQQSIVVKARVMDTQDWFSNSEVELHSDIRLDEVNGNAPQVRWPLAFQYDGGELLARLSVVAHRNDGNHVFADVPVADANVQVRVYQPVKATIHEVTLPKDDDGSFPWSLNGDTSVDMDLRIDEATAVAWTTVPEGAKRLIAQSHGTTESPLQGSLDLGNALIYIGKDYNQDGIIQPFDEILCVSNHIIYDNFCNINNPEAGDYWTIVYNSKKTGKEGVLETFRYSVTVVTDDVATDMNAQFTDVDQNNTGKLSVNWQLQGMEEGDVYYTVMDVGTSANNPGNIGRIPLTLTRGKDDVSLQVGRDPEQAKTKANAGEYVPYTFTVLANQTGADRPFSITTQIPEGLVVKPENVLLNRATAADVSINDGKLVIAGIQPDTSKETPHYNITSNMDDAMCRTPNFGNSKPGGYVDLAQFGINPYLDGLDSKGVPNFRNGVTLPISTIFGGTYRKFALYDNADALNAANFSLGIRGTGIVDLWGGQPFFYAFHLGFPYQSFPYESIGVMWRMLDLLNGGNKTDIMAAPLSSNSGITVASTQTGWGIVEWDDARSFEVTGKKDPVTGRYPERNDRFDFELIFNVNTRYGDGEHELYMAYDNIDFADTDGRGVIGLQGFKGPIYSRGPLSAYLGEQYAYNDLDSKVKSGLVLCYDYVGPESSQFEVTVWAQVPSNGAGQSYHWQSISQVAGMGDQQFNHTLTVDSNLTLGALADVSTDEDTAVTGLTVQFADENSDVNNITVTGDHVTATVHGHDTGATFDLMPEPNFTGTTAVTVTVADVDNPADKTSKTFTLTVKPVNDAPVAALSASASSISEGQSLTLTANASDVDGDSLSYQWSSNVTASGATATVTGLAVGSHTFTVTVSDGVMTSEASVTVQVTAKAQESTSGSSSGSFGWASALLLLVAGLRRKARRG